MHTYDAHGLPYFISSSGVMQFRKAYYTAVAYAPYTQVSYRILGRGYFSTSLFAENKYTEIEGRGSHLK